MTECPPLTHIHGIKRVIGEAWHWQAACTKYTAELNDGPWLSYQDTLIYDTGLNPGLKPRIENQTAQNMAVICFNKCQFNKWYKPIYGVIESI